MKRGTTSTSIKTREANRYLEQRFRYRSPYLAGQQLGEAIKLQESEQWNSNPSFIEIAGCCRYFQERFPTRNCAIVTDDEQLQSCAKSFNVNTVSSKNWKKMW